MTRDELIQKIKSLTPSALSTVKKAETLFYQSVEDGNIHRTIYSIGLNGKTKRDTAQTQGPTVQNSAKTKPTSFANIPMQNTRHLTRCTISKNNSKKSKTTQNFLKN